MMQASAELTDLKTDIKILNGNVNEVAGKEDLVFALRNNILKVNEVVPA